MSDDEHFTPLIDPPPLSRQEIEEVIGTKLNDLSLYQKAFTHKSAMKKYKLTDSFETLEFMGDSVLGFIITKMLFDRHEAEQEGFLTKIRTKLVRGSTLADIARKLGLAKWILMDEKGTRNGWNTNEKVLEDAFEALIGAIYMDLGLLHTKRFILGIYNDPAIVDMNVLMIDDNFKDQLMRYCQANKFDLPEYVVDKHENGVFHIHVVVNGVTLGSGTARSKKQAEQESAKIATVRLKIS